MARYDDLNTNMIAYATVLSIIVLVLVLQGVQALTNNMIRYEDDRKISTTPINAEIIRQSQFDSMKGYKRQTVQNLRIKDETVPREVLMIPIDEAKKLVVKEFATAQ